MLSQSNWRSAMVVLSLWCVAFAATAQAQTQLKWKFTPGTNLKHTITQDSDTSMNLGQQPVTSKMTMVVTTSWQVNDVSDQGVADITQTFTSIKFKLSSFAVNLDYDSASGKEPTDPIGSQIAKSVKPLLDSKFNFKISERGEISDVTVPEETRKLLASVQVGPQMGGALSPDSFIGMIKESVLPFPNEPVQKGSSWKHKSELKAPPLGTMTNNITATYEGTANVEGKPLEQVKIDVTSALAFDEKNPLQVAIKTQSEQGKLYFDNAAGRLSHTETIQNLVMEITAQGQKIEQTMKTVKKARLTLAQK